MGSLPSNEVMELHGATTMAEEQSNAEKEVAEGPQNGEVPDAERGNCGELASGKEDIGGKASAQEDDGKKEGFGGKSSAAGEDLNGDESEQALPPPVVRDGRRYLSIQR